MRTTTAVAIIAALTLVGCVTQPEEPAAPDSALYLGAGRGETLGRAITAAKMDAVRRAVIDLIGREAEAAQADRLDEVLYSTANPNAYVYNETMERLQRDGSLIEGDVYYEISIRVNVGAVRRTLAANGIGEDIARDASGARPGASGASADREDGASSGGVTVPESGEPTYGDVTAEEKQFIARYVDTMTYMVYFDEQAGAGLDGREFVLRSAVNQANGYLVSNGRLVVDADQVETLKEDQRLVYEEQVGQELSLLQWVARRLNADVYVEIDATVSSRTSGNGHYATADVTVNMYETSTGQILGSVNRGSRESFSRTSAQDAAINAVQSTVYQAMPLVVETAERQMERALGRGIRYEVTLQRPPDSRTLAAFRRIVGEDVRSIATVSQSPSEVLYEVFFIGSMDDLVDLLFAASDRVAGFERMSLVISRGRSLTFDVGL